MSLILLQEMLEDADLFGLIAAGDFATSYDLIAQDIFKSLSKDLSIDQITSIIWEVFYQHYCICEIAETKEPFILDKKSAVAILGDTDRYKDIAFNIRHTVIGL